MKYYVTIYIDKLFGEITRSIDIKNPSTYFEDFTHAFLGLTKDKSPDELDKVDEQLRQEYLKNKEFKLIKSIK
ncbi:hypothetical protein ACOQXD_001882 [Campylobacter jejuni]